MRSRCSIQPGSGLRLGDHGVDHDASPVLIDVVVHAEVVDPEAKWRIRARSKMLDSTAALRRRLVSQMVLDPVQYANSVCLLEGAEVCVCIIDEIDPVGHFDG